MDVSRYLSSYNKQLWLFHFPIPVDAALERLELPPVLLFHLHGHRSYLRPAHVPSRT